MKIFTTLKTLIIGAFVIMLAGKYFGFIENYPITEDYNLYDISYLFLFLYITVRIAEYVSNRKSNKNEKK